MKPLLPPIANEFCSNTEKLSRLQTLLPIPAEMSSGWADLSRGKFPGNRYSSSRSSESYLNWSKLRGLLEEWLWIVWRSIGRNLLRMCGRYVGYCVRETRRGVLVAVIGQERCYKSLRLDKGVRLPERFTGRTDSWAIDVG